MKAYFEQYFQVVLFGFDNFANLSSVLNLALLGVKGLSLNWPKLISHIILSFVINAFMSAHLSVQCSSTFLYPCNSRYAILSIFLEINYFLLVAF